MKKTDSLLLQACIRGMFGRMIERNACRIYEAGFIYLTGKPDWNLLRENIPQWKNRMFICLNEEWERRLQSVCNEFKAVTRYQMKQRNFDLPELRELVTRIDSKYEITDFNQEIFTQHPFGHGWNYSSYDEFCSSGVGNVIVYQGKFISSASSYLTYENEVELDISTLPEYRRQGLALACCADMLLKSNKKGLKVHWDAQNEASYRLACKLGYQLEEAYEAYTL